MKQFDSSIVGQPYSRVMSIFIRYTAPMTAVVDVILQQHVKLFDGTHTALGSSETLTFGIETADLATGTVALRDVSNGALMGATMTMGQLFTGVASLIREKELAAEAAAQTPTVLALSGALGMSSAQLDELFISAAQIEA